MHRPLRVVAVTALMLLAAACGSTDDDDNSTSATDSDAPRTVEIEMRDIEFVPQSIDVQQGETVTFVFTNTGDVAHDAFIGDAAAQDDHEMQMNEAATTRWVAMVATATWTRTKLRSPWILATPAS